MLPRLSIDFIKTSRLFKRQRHYSALLTDETLRRLRQQAQHNLASNLDVDLEVHQQLLGDQLSPFVKSGYEFAEIRAYQPGDNVRFINWRRYANSGQLYINRFHEERRPQCWIILDRRDSMRFGTHIRLKVAQAAILALYHLYKAQYQQMAIGGVILESQSHWYEAKSSEHALQPLQQHIIAPCPPMQTTSDDTQLESALRNLKARCVPGCFIFIISDFSDIRLLSSSTLAALCAEHTISALHVVDQVEQALPEHGVFNLTNPGSDQVLNIDCDNQRSRSEMNQSLQQSLHDIEQTLRQYKLHYRQISAQQDLLTQNEIADARKTD